VSDSVLSPSDGTPPVLDVRGERTRIFCSVLHSATALLDEGDEHALLSHFCAALTREVPHIALAWTWFGPADTTEIVPQVRAGSASAYADALHVVRDRLTARGPAFRALAGERVPPFRIGAASPFGPWRDAANQHGMRDVLALPLRSTVDDQRGVFVLYADVDDFFRQVGQELFESLAELFSAVLSRAARQAALARAATTDALTGLYNRHALPLLAHRLARATDAAAPAALLMVDLDHFKRVNDDHGHAAGDAVLRLAADAMQAAMRHGDLVARWGGEEFLVGLPGVDAAAARVVADKLRAQLAALLHPQADGSVLQLTASIGVAQVRAGETLSSAIQRADAALYTAKRCGRDRVSVA